VDIGNVLNIFLLT